MAQGSGAYYTLLAPSPLMPLGVEHYRTPVGDHTCVPVPQPLMLLGVEYYSLDKAELN